MGVGVLDTLTDSGWKCVIHRRNEMGRRKKIFTGFEAS